MHRHRALKQADLIASLPRHLRQFARQQSVQDYRPRDHAVWRFILRQLVASLNDTAHPVYQQGLKQTGISLEHIPSIDDMNTCLADLGWAAVVVDGFIPPAIFMEFQARRILPIAQGMRQIKHMLYTPAPDIVHESAGHAPFIVDVDYAEFLQRFGEIGMKAIATEADFAVYEAIRHLSIVKESPHSSAAEIRHAQTLLDEALAANDNGSEAALLARLHWWTVEYGLVGTPQDYRIFGAGLLSSLGESRSCLDNDKVPKHTLTLQAVNTAYDITNTQPQLFVARSCKHLSQVLESFAAGMSFMQGGRKALETAQTSGSVCTAQYNSGLQISGRFVRVDCDAMGEPVYLATQGPTQLAYAQRQLHRHGTTAHAEGFGSPLGQLVDMPRCLSGYSMDELKAQGITVGQAARLDFVSGVCVNGILHNILREDGLNLIMSFHDCRVTGPSGQVLFDPAWGDYDMAVGTSIVSVWGGAADREHYDLYRMAAQETRPREKVDGSPSALQQAYADIRQLRQLSHIDAATLDEQWQSWLQHGWFDTEWLLQWELLELAQRVDHSSLAQTLRNKLHAQAAKSDDAEESHLIHLGLQALETA